MRAVGEETFEAAFRQRHRVGTGDADRVKAARRSAGDERLLDCNRVGQKSRLA
jgi:hypothetical protein